MNMAETLFQTGKGSRARFGAIFVEDWWIYMISTREEISECGKHLMSFILRIGEGEQTSYHLQFDNDPRGSTGGTLPPAV
ncbi:hypothetical protein Taro_040563 [Colocasia esculenta]|uniref:Uncharacterized protein n=1 Tax=Colocasia esculenta TaxID=4460 RepID=A0A843WQT0_COLES|nr:hypothetical protein [Colocasia esculenta]